MNKNTLDTKLKDDYLNEIASENYINKLVTTFDTTLRNNLSVSIDSYIIGFHRIPNELARYTKFTNDLFMLGNEIEKFQKEVDEITVRINQIVNG